MVFFLLILLAFAVSWLLTRLTLYLFLRYQWLDTPNHRSAHQEPIPTGGGLGFGITFLAGCGLLYSQGLLDARGQLATLLLLPLLLLGLLDDRFHLGIWPRLGVQVLLVWLMLLSLPTLPAVPLGSFVWQPAGVLAWLAAVIGLVWFINLYNFMDGIDGIAILQALFVAAAFMLLAWQAGQAPLVWLAGLLIGSGLGFLFFNLPPARLFMGDTGSYFLAGACLLLGLLGAGVGIATPWTWLILVAPFVTDATLTLLSRLCQGEVWYHAHASHAYQHAARLSAGHGRVLVVMTAINILWLLPLAWISARLPSQGLFCFILAYMPLCLLWYAIRRRGQGVGVGAAEAPGMADD